MSVDSCEGPEGPQARLVPRWLCSSLTWALRHLPPRGHLGAPEEILLTLRLTLRPSIYSPILNADPPLGWGTACEDSLLGGQPVGQGRDKRVREERQELNEAGGL